MTYTIIYIYVCCGPDARRESADDRSVYIDESQRIPLTPDYSTRGGSGCLKKKDAVAR